MDALLTWFRAHSASVVAMASVLSLGTVLFVPWIVARIPADYFAQVHAPPLPWAEAHPVLRVSLHVLKNLLGVVLLLAGVAMLVLPGQGLLTLFVAFLMLEGPGKRRFEMWLVRRSSIHAVIDWIRRRAGRRPLDLGDSSGPDLHSGGSIDDSGRANS